MCELLSVLCPLHFLIIGRPDPVPSLAFNKHIVSRCFGQVVIRGRLHGSALVFWSKECEENDIGVHATHEDADLKAGQQQYRTKTVR